MNKEIVTYDIMYQAYIDCRKKKKNKVGTKKFEKCALYNISKLIKEINNRSYNIKRSQCFIVKYPTKREVFCANFRDRVVQHFVYNELNPYMDKCFIYDTANCRPDKGTDFAINRVSAFIKKATKNNTQDAYFLKVDLSGFFMSIDRQLLLSKVIDFINNKYKGEYPDTLKYLVKLIILHDCTKDVDRISPISDWDGLPPNKTLFGNDNGLPIGNICSQLFANFYLNDLDHELKQRHKYVSRYVDDIIVIDEDKEKLKETLGFIKEYLPHYNLKLNLNKTRIDNVKHGIRYLGVKIYCFNTILGKSRINRTYYAGRLFEDAENDFPKLACRWGMFKNYHGKTIGERWYQSLSKEITKDISYDRDEGFSYNNQEYHDFIKSLHTFEKQEEYYEK